MIGSMIEKRKEEEAAKATSEAQAIIDTKKRARAESARKKFTSMQYQETVVQLRTPADGPSVAETKSVDGLSVRAKTKAAQTQPAEQAAETQPAEQADCPSVAETKSADGPSVAETKSADGPDVAETESVSEPSVAGRKMKLFTFRFNSIANRSAAYQKWKQDKHWSSSSSVDGKFDLSTSAGFSTSASSDDESSVKESTKISEEDLGSDQTSVAGSQ